MIDLLTQSERQYCKADPAWSTMKLSQLWYVIVMTAVLLLGSIVNKAPIDSGYRR